MSSIAYLKTFLVSSLLFLFALQLVAQEGTIVDIVYLKDNSYLKGKIIAETDDQITLQLLDESTIQLSTKNIQQIKRTKNPQLIYPNGTSFIERGHYHVINSGLLVGYDYSFDEFKLGGHLLHFIKGYQFNPYFALGAGVGVDQYDFTMIPIYADVRGNLFNRSIAPFYALNVGYSFAFGDNNNGFFNEDFRGGWLIHPTLGLRFATRKSMSYTLEFGYKFQYAERRFFDTKDKLRLQRMTFKAGVQF
ncbi:MAG: hypothetical protein AAGD05_13905 [Bacteroidota bacterium]